MVAVRGVRHRHPLRPASHSVNGPIHETGRLIPLPLLPLPLVARYLTLLFSKVLNFLDCRRR